MKKLMAQVFKFAIVGGISFLVDFAVYGIMCNILGIHYIISGVAGFFLSVVVNYLLSMRYVFVSKEDMRKDKEFVIFVVLSLIGMVLNSVILFVCIDLTYMNWLWLKQLIDIEIMNLAAKIIATGIVMVYNFVTRKIFLEKRKRDRMVNFNPIKVILKMLGIILGASFAGLLFLWAVYMLPVDAMRGNMVKSEGLIRAQEAIDIEHLGNADWAEVLDTGTNIIMYHEVIYPNTGNAFEDSLLAPGGNIWQKAVGDWTSGLMKYANGAEYKPESEITYARYWHGYLVLLKPLFFLMDLQGIYILNTIALIGLCAAVLYLLYKRLGMYVSAYVVTILCMHPEKIVQSFQLSSIFYALNITLLLLLIKKDWKVHQIFYIFLLDGILVAFFDFLTYPAVAAAIPLLTYFLLDAKEGFKDNFITMVLNGCSFLLGYAGMWGMKWVFATLFTQQNVIADAINSVLHRTGVVEKSADLGITWGVGESLYRNIYTFWDDTNTCIILITVIVAGVLLMKKKNELQKNKQVAVYSILMMLVPFAWFVVLSNHCALHPHLEWRTLSIFVYAAGVFVISLFPKKHN